ncbi:MAG: leader peptidase (prepilin peptidase) / N-methyltransferase [Thermoleophilaceae bacterium]|nr:leader peptidase (prepilin peptidase) / N-methyltransferase [Thermoleophilaceae bacterium]
MELAFAAPFGLVVGSFLNVVAYRVPRGESIDTPASRCPGCDTPIKPWDNIPLLSWIFLRGRCRSCSTRISARYPLVELVTGLLFAGIVLSRGVRNDDLVVLLPFAATLIAVADIDLEHRIVPNKILLPMAVYGIAASAVVRTDMLPELLIAGGAAFTFLLLAALIHPAGMGMGDVKLAGVMGLYLGASIAPALLVAFLSGSVVGIAVMLRHGAQGRKRGVPFAPFLALGGVVALFAGTQLVHLYIHHFL